MNVWRCKRCRQWGIGGPAGFVKHEKSAHDYAVRLGASMAFGFTGQYSDGLERRYDRYIRPAVARESEYLTSSDYRDDANLDEYELRSDEVTDGTIGRFFQVLVDA